MINYLDLLLYRPTKKDKCEKCEDFENNLNTKTEIQRKEHAIHLQQGEYMKNRMCDEQATCSSSTLGQKKSKKKKQLVKKTQLGANGANDSENAPETSQQSISKDSNEKNAPKTSQESTSKDSNEKNAPEKSHQSTPKDSNEKAPQKKCDDIIAHIATDMQQIQNVPKLQVGMAYYKSKVNNHKS